MKWLVSFIAVFITGFACADNIQTYDFVNVSFANGAGGIPATGNFQWDWTTNTVAGLTLQADGINFYLGGSYPAHVTTSSIDGSYDYQNVSYDIALVYTSPVTPTSGSTIDTTQSLFTIDPGNPATYYASGGSVVLQSVPEPSSWLCLSAFSIPLLALKRKRLAAK